MRVNGVSSTRVPRRFRLRLLLIRTAKWLVPAPRCFTLPFAVRRNRFLVPLCVFIFGIAKSFLACDAQKSSKTQDFSGPAAAPQAVIAGYQHSIGLFGCGFGVEQPKMARNCDANRPDEKLPQESRANQEQAPGLQLARLLIELGGFGLRLGEGQPGSDAGAQVAGGGEPTEFEHLLLFAHQLEQLFGSWMLG